MKTDFLSRWLLGLVLAVGLVGLGALLRWRFAEGDVYPPYSSLRADPLGTKALFEAIAGLPGLKVEREFLGWTRTSSDGERATILVLGLSDRALSEMPESWIRSWEATVLRGGRLVLALRPPRWEAPRQNPEAPADETRPRPRDPGVDEPLTDAGLVPDSGPKLSAASRWEFAVERVPPSEGKLARAQRVADIPGPDSLPWPSSVRLGTNGVNWTVWYALEERPVIMQRSLGQGSIVVLADSYLFSNEAISQERESGLLAHVVGPLRVVRFDEVHLGVEARPGVATLARRYRLHGLAAGLLVTLLLWLWRQSVRLLPPTESVGSTSEGSTLAGQDAASGLVHLLRRSLPLKEVVSVCFDRWRASVGERGPKWRMEAMRVFLAGKDTPRRRREDPVELFARLTQLAQRATPPPAAPEGAPVPVPGPVPVAHGPVAPKGLSH